LGAPYGEWAADADLPTRTARSLEDQYPLRRALLGMTPIMPEQHKLTMIQVT
jgi:hypothetical protein